MPVEEFEIRELEIRKLNLEQTLTHLMGGGIIIVRGVEETNKGDVLIRLDPRRQPVTQVSLDIHRKPDSIHAKPYWWVQDIPFNYFVTRDVYEFTTDYQDYNPKYQVGDIVQYTYEKEDLTIGTDTAFIEKVFVSQEEEKDVFYYSISKEQGKMREESLQPI